MVKAEKGFYILFLYFENNYTFTLTAMMLEYI